MAAAGKLSGSSPSCPRPRGWILDHEPPCIEKERAASELFWALSEVADPGDELERERSLCGLGRGDVQQRRADHVDIGAVNGPQHVGQQWRTGNFGNRHGFNELLGLVAADALL